MFKLIVNNIRFVNLSQQIINRSFEKRNRRPSENFVKLIYCTPSWHPTHFFFFWVSLPQPHYLSIFETRKTQLKTQFSQISRIGNRVSSRVSLLSSDCQLTLSGTVPLIWESYWKLSNPKTLYWMFFVQSTILLCFSQLRNRRDLENELYCFTFYIFVLHLSLFYLIMS